MDDEQFRQMKALIGLMNDRLDRLEGDLMGTQAAIRALIISQLRPSTAIADVAAEIEKLTSVALPSTSSEAFLDGVARAKQCVLPTDDDQQRARRKS